MGMSRTQFPAYMNRIYGRKATNLTDNTFSVSRLQSYEVPNLNLFPSKDQKRGQKPELTEEHKK